MKKKIVLFTLISMFLLFAMVLTSVAAQPRVPGVAEGDWFKYEDISVEWSSNDPNATFPPPDWEWLEEMNETEWMLLTVGDVSGTNITCQFIEHFKNDTERIRSGYIDIDTGNCSKDTAETADMTFTAISANLDVNHTLYTSGEYSTWKINETIVRTYPDEVRDTNHINMTWEYSWTDPELGWYYYYYFSMNWYWDRTTGILVEGSFEEIIQEGGYVIPLGRSTGILVEDSLEKIAQEVEYETTWSALFRITDSKVWVVPEFLTWTSILLTFTILTVAIAIYKRRLFKTPIH